MKYYFKGYKQIAEIIPPRISVTDVCAGDGALFKYALKGRNKYIGIDINPIKDNNQYINSIKSDILVDQIPT